MVTETTASALRHGVVGDGTASTVSADHSSAGSLLLSTEADDALPVISNGTFVGETVHGVPASLFMTGALAFQTNQPVSATQMFGQVIQVANVPLTNIFGNSLGQITEQLFTVFSYRNGFPDATNLVKLFPEDIWNNAMQDWLLLSSHAATADAGTSPKTLEHPAAGQQANVVDRAFAQLADEADDFSDWSSF